MKKQLIRRLTIKFICALLAVSVSGCTTHLETTGETVTDGLGNNFNQSGIANEESTFVSGATEQTAEESEPEENVSKIAYLAASEAEYDYSNVQMFSEGAFCFQDESSGLWGYIDTEGNIIIEPQFYKVYSFCEGLAAVMNSDSKWNFIDKTGKEVISGNFDMVFQKYLISEDYRLGEIYDNTFMTNGFLNGEALVVKDGEFQFIDTNGDIIKKVSVSGISGSRCCLYGDFLVAEYAGSYYYTTPYEKAHSHTSMLIDKEFNFIYKKGRIYPSRFCSNIILWDNSIEKAFLNSQGEKIYDISLENIRNSISSYYTDKYYTVQKEVNGIVKQAVYTIGSGECVFDFKYKEIIPLPNETFVVTTNDDNVGVIDINENEIIPLSEKNSYYFNYYLDLMLMGNCLYNYKTGEMFTNDAFLDGDLKEDLFFNRNSSDLGSGSYFANGLYYIFRSEFHALRIYKIDDDGYKVSDYIEMLDIPGNYEDYIEYGVLPQIVKGENGEKDHIVFSHLVIE